MQAIKNKCGESGERGRGEEQSDSDRGPGGRRKAGMYWDPKYAILILG